MQTIRLNIHDICVKTGPGKCGTITSSLREAGPDSEVHNAAVDAVESFILAAACEGIDIQSQAFLSAIQTTIDAISNHLP